MPRFQSAARLFRVAAQKSMAATQRAHVALAKRKHAEVLATDPKPVSFERFVDGRKGAPEEAVRPGGVIIYRYPRLDLVVQYAMEVLFDVSPVLSGAYRNAHTIFVNGVPVPNLKGWQPGDEVVITNPLPYARKIEVGKMKMRVPGTDLVYQQARRRVAGRYGNAAKVEFTYRGIVGGIQVNQALAASSGQPWWLGGGAARAATGSAERRVAETFGKTAHNQGSRRYPCLVIREL